MYGTPLPIRRAAQNGHIVGMMSSSYPGTTKEGETRHNDPTAEIMAAATKPKLSLADRSIVAKHPFGSSLNAVRAQLQSADDPLASWQFDDVQRSLLLTQLLVTFMAHEAAYYLRLPGSSSNLASDLGRLIEQMAPRRTSTTTTLNYSHLQPLVEALLGGEPDVELWEIVYTLVDTYRRPDSARSFSSADTLTNITFPQPPSKAAPPKDDRQHLQALTNKVFIADVVERNDFFFPFEPTAQPGALHRQREAFAQAILRDLDRLYIRIIDERHDYEAFRKITKGVRSLGPRFALWRFEVVLFHVVKRLDVELADFEVFRGLQAWKGIKKRKKGEVVAAQAPQLELPEIELGAWD